MAWGLLEDEDQLKLDPALADFVRQRTGAPPAVPAQEAAPMPGVGPSPQDAAAMAELEKLAAKDERTQGLGYLGGLLSDAGALMRGKDRPFRAPPQVDDSIRKFIISRKMGAGGVGAKPGSSAVTDAEVEALVSAGVPREAAQAARVDPPTFRKLYEKHYEPRKADEMPPNLAADPDITARGEKVGIKQQTLEKPADFRNRVLAAEESKSGGVGRVSDNARKDTIELRKEFNNLPAVRDMETAATSYKKVKTTSESGAGDISLIFAYMKMLDPGSTVREGEFATAANAGSIPQSVMAAYNKAVNGEKLAAPVRQMFKEESRKVYAATRDRYKLKAGEYKRIARDLGLNPEHVVTEMGLEEDAPARPGDEFLK